MINPAEVTQKYEQGMSLRDIAAEFNTYPNRIRRIITKYKPSAIRNKSEAQTLALKTGKIAHPTKGKERSQDVRIKISQTMYDHWHNMSEEDYESLCEFQKHAWNNKSAEEKENFIQSGLKAIRVAAREGSKLEKYLQNELTNAGFQVIFHKTGLILSDKLEIDILLPANKVVIEIDGPSHYYPVWGEERLKQHLAADAKKTGLLIQAGFVVIRVGCLVSKLMNIHKRNALSEILRILKEIEVQFPPKDKRLIEIRIGDDRINRFNGKGS